jgi:hypothetical protein
VPAEVFGLESYSDPVGITARVSRDVAMQVGAVKRSHDLIAGTLGQLPLTLYSPAGVATASPLLAQPEPNVARSVTMTRTVADMLFDGVAWWQVIARDFRNYPTKVKRRRADEVTFKEGAAYVNGTPVDDADLIRFDSPNPPLLTAGARAIRTALLLDSAAANAANGVPPVDYFTPAEGADPADDTEIVDLLTEWETARKARRTGYVPAALNYNVGGWNPEQLQLADQRAAAKLEVALHAGIDPEEVGVSTTSRTYANAFDRRKSFTDFTLGNYRQAFEDRLGMKDVTPTGFYTRFDLSAFLRSDDLTRLTYHEKALALGLETLEEAIAVERGLPAPATPAAAAPPLRSIPNTGSAAANA